MLQLFEANSVTSQRLKQKKQPVRLALTAIDNTSF